MPTYTAAQVSVMARSVGWPHPDLVGQIAMAESSGRSDIVNGIGATGLVQVNQPVHVGSHPTWTTQWLKDPINNLKAGLVLYQADKAGGGDGYRPWDESRPTWSTSAAAKAAGIGASSSSSHATPAEDPCAQLSGAPKEYCEAGEGGADPLPGTGDVAGQIARIAQSIALAANWVANPHNWVRVVYVIGGSALALAAVATIAAPPVTRSYKALPTGAVRAIARGLK